MRIAGLIGGLGPESTIDYYRAILRGCRERRPDLGAPGLVIDSVDIDVLIALVERDDRDGMVEYLLASCRRLAAAGAAFGLITANTPHLVFDRLAPRSPLPLLSIVDAARDAVRARGYARVALLGTRFTMRARFYPDAFDRAGIALVTPAPDEQDRLHAIYLGELLKNEFRDDSRAAVMAIVRRMRAAEGVEAVLLAGTELPLLLRGVAEPGLPLLDTAELHAQRVVDELLAGA